MEATLQEKLKTVAEFCGYKVWADDVFLKPQRQKDIPPYHTDYNWLMEAWVKFRDLDFSMNPNEYKLLHEDVHCDLIAQEISFDEISQAFDRLYEAITWYNSINK